MLSTKKNKPKQNKTKQKTNRKRKGAKIRKTMALSCIYICLWFVQGSGKFYFSFGLAQLDNGLRVSFL